MSEAGREDRDRDADDAGARDEPERESGPPDREPEQRPEPRRVLEQTYGAGDDLEDTV